MVGADLTEAVLSVHGTSRRCVDSGTLTLSVKPERDPEPEHSTGPEHSAVVVPQQSLMESDIIFYKLMQHINSTGTCKSWWESRFGPITIADNYGESFWSGFEKEFAEYLRTRRLDYFPPQSFGKFYFKKPVRFSKAAAREPCSGDNPAEVASYFPCVATDWGQPYFKMVCIHIAVMRTRPWAVHPSWLVAMP